MAKFNALFNNFARGEVSEKALARIDLDAHKRSLRTCENFIVTPEGGVAYRGGTRFFKDGTGSRIIQRLIPFIFSKTEAYTIAVGESNLQGWRNTGTASTLGALPLSGLISSIQDTELDDLHYAQSADVLYLTHPSYPPCAITRTSANTFSYRDWDIPLINGSAEVASKFRALRHPFRDRNISAITMTPSATTGAGINLTASAAYFNSGMVGALFRVNHAGTEGVIRITGYTSTTVVTGTVLVDFGATTASADWAESAWSTYRGFPRSVAIFEERLVFFGNEAQPDSLRASHVGNFEHFMEERLPQDSSTNASGLNYYGDPTDLDPVSYTIASNEVNQAQWVSAGRGTLAVGTLGAEYRINGSEGRIMSASAVSVTPQTSHGSSHVQPIRVGLSTLFVQRDGKRIRELSFDFESNADFAADLNLLSDHIVRHDESGIDFTGAQDYSGQEFVELAYDKSRSVIWARTSRGHLVGLTLNADLEIAGWHRHILAGTVDGTNPPTISGMCVIPSQDGTTDELYLSVNRRINGNNETFVEKLGPAFENVTLVSESTNENDYPWFLDSAVRVTSYGSPTTTFTGLSRFNGETVSVLADGTVHDDVAVSGGSITLDDEYEEVIVGLGYTGKVRLPRLNEGGSKPGGYVQTLPVRVHQAAVMVIRSFFFKIGISTFDGEDFTDSLDEVSLFVGGEENVGPLRLFTGWKDKIAMRSGAGDDWFVMIQQDEPLPLEIAAIQLMGQTND